jgi:hypothetical protein
MDTADANTPETGCGRGTSGGPEPAPSFCHACGQPYPWIEDALKAAAEAADLLENLNEAEREDLKRDLDDLVRETPRAPVAALRFRRVVTKAGREAPELFKDLFVGVVSSAVLKQRGLG